MWSPSKSALNLTPTSGWSWIARHWKGIGWNDWTLNRCRVGARFNKIGNSFKICICLVHLSLVSCCRICRTWKLTSNFIVILHVFFQKTYKKRLEKEQYNFVRETTLIQNKFWTRNNNRTCRIIYPFSKKIISKSTIFTFQYYRNRLKYPLSQIFLIIHILFLNPNKYSKAFRNRCSR